MTNPPNERPTVTVGGDAIGNIVVGNQNTITTQQGPPRPNTAPRRDDAARNPTYRPLLAADIARSSGRGNAASTAIRGALRTALQESLRQSGIEWDHCQIHDLGDGFRIAAPAHTPKTAMIHPLLQQLAHQLHSHNRLAGELTQIRVRVALHAGDIAIDDTGAANGRPLEILARMLDATPLRAALDAAPPAHPLAALLSAHFYEETVPHGYPGINAEDFHRCPFTTKEYTADAWLYAPGSSLPARASEARQQP
ncbi:hypothetical protein [Actinomadura harenae]|uniref:Guanylate cyclase domain-containing protein n=1 Tax=Actinomadura harenae TaxID=2483351 RepID=A0A3M2M8M8_9ACTN|nr:hypothetical protein [Actinomadura harenae]RMI46174.1 hypothetical protein EBO15_08140 [Actinomadura harenae]